jgi:hypothetical protein
VRPKIGTNNKKSKQQMTIAAITASLLASSFSMITWERDRPNVDMMYSVTELR